MILSYKIRESVNLDEWANKMAEVFGHDLAEIPSIVPKQIHAYRAFDASSQLQNLKSIPTIIISGDEDPIAPPKLGQALANGIPNAHFHILENASHGMTVTHAEEINKLLDRHFSNVSNT